MLGFQRNLQFLLTSLSDLWVLSSTSEHQILKARSSLTSIKLHQFMPAEDLALCPLVQAWAERVSLVQVWGEGRMQGETLLPFPGGREYLCMETGKDGGEHRSYSIDQAYCPSCSVSCLWRSTGTSTTALSVGPSGSCHCLPVYRVWKSPSTSKLAKNQQSSPLGLHTCRKIWELFFAEIKQLL